MQEPRSQTIRELEQAARQLEQSGQRAQALEKMRELEQVIAQAQGGPATFEGLRRTREVLQSQLESLQEMREEIADQLREPMVSGSDKAGLSRRIEQLDQRIEALDVQVATVDAQMARAAASMPGLRISSRESGPPGRSGPPPEEFVVLGGLFILAVLLPLTIAYARRIWRRGAQAVSDFPREIAERLAKMDQNIDTVALEVERIGESQRYLTRVLAEQQSALPAGAAKPVEVPQREGDWQRRSP
jgi:hypothetical protein